MQRETVAGRRSTAGCRMLPVLLCVVLLGSTSHAQAQQQSREREALRRAQQQVSKLQQDHAALEAEKGALEQKLKAAEAELGKLKGQVGSLKRQSSALQAAQQDNAELKGKLATTETSLQETRHKCQAEAASLHTALNETEAALARTREERAQNSQRLEASVKVCNERTTTCEAKNQKLYGVTMDLVTRYKENRGVWEKFLLSEPFTQLKSVQVESLLEQMRDRADEAKIQPRADGK